MFWEMNHIALPIVGFVIHHHAETAHSVPPVRRQEPSHLFRPGNRCGGSAFMSQRDSGYARKERDCYETPEWVTLALVPHLPVINGSFWEPAAGSGKMFAALHKAGFQGFATDISANYDFLTRAAPFPFEAIITNPPYELATEFIERALSMIPRHGFVAMLLRTDFDHAKTRRHLFGQCDKFAKKLVLTKRIKWFEDSKGQPSFNHAWYIWDARNRDHPIIVYGPDEVIQTPEQQPALNDMWSRPFDHPERL